MPFQHPVRSPAQGVPKRHNVERNFRIRHASYYANYPAGSALRAETAHKLNADLSFFSETNRTLTTQRIYLHLACFIWMVFNGFFQKKEILTSRAKQYRTLKVLQEVLSAEYDINIYQFPILLYHC